MGGDYSLTYAQICRASLYLQHRPTMPFIITSKDTFDQLPGRRHPGPTYIAATAIEASSGVAPVVVGKPSRVLAESLIAEHALDPLRTCMIGDRLDSDIVFGNIAGFTSLLVMSGVTSKEEIEQLVHAELVRSRADDIGAEPSLSLPNCCVGSLADLLSYDD